MPKCQPFLSGWKSLAQQPEACFQNIGPKAGCKIDVDYYHLRPVRLLMPLPFLGPFSADSNVNGMW